MVDFYDLKTGDKVVLLSLEDATCDKGNNRRYTANGLFINPQMYKYFGREVTVDYIYTETQQFSILEDPRWDWNVSCISYIGNLETFDPASEDELVDMLFGG